MPFTLRLPAYKNRKELPVVKIIMLPGNKAGWHLSEQVNSKLFMGDVTAKPWVNDRLDGFKILNTHAFS